MRAATQRDIYGETVELLRDLSRNHAAAAADMCRCALEEAWAAEDPVAGGAGAPERHGEDVPELVEDLGWMLRELEDVGLAAVCRLARAAEDERVLDAIEDAGAGWLRAVILNRAAETIRAGRD